MTLSRAKRTAREERTPGPYPHQGGTTLMLSTSLAALVLSGLAAASSVSQPTWQTDYATAVARAAESRKPIAVFIAHGGAGYAKLVADGSLPSDATRVLRQSYVCLY